MNVCLTVSRSQTTSYQATSTTNFAAENILHVKHLFQIDDGIFGSNFASLVILLPHVLGMISWMQCPTLGNNMSPFLEMCASLMYLICKFPLLQLLPVCLLPHPASQNIMVKHTTICTTTLSSIQACKIVMPCRNIINLTMGRIIPQMLLCMSIFFTFVRR